MAKNKVTGNGGRSSTSRKPAVKAKKKETRVILFPTEPTTIPEEELRRAVEKVIAARKK